jgi:pyrroline-5-carboxylate reductase
VSSPANSPLKIGFLGAGQMATALARGWLAAGLMTPQTCRASDPVPAARTRFTEHTRCQVSTDNREVVTASDVLVLAVKPQAVPDLLTEIRGSVADRHLVVSICAGVPLRQLAAGLSPAVRIVRVMPNTPCLVGASATAFAPGPGCRPEDASLVERLFAAVGKAFALPESLLDAVTGLSGSGPAFVYVMIEALADGGVRMGLPRDAALALAAQTVLGSARMVLETGQHPGLLKDAVASPGGTTIAGLHALERGGVRAAFMDAVEAATKRSADLGGK